MKKKIMIGSAIASTLTASSMVTGYTMVRQFAKKILYREHLTYSEDEWYEELNAKKVKIKNRKGLLLQAYLIEKEHATHTVICLHALTLQSSSLKETVQYLSTLFKDANILLYDANAHGLSDGYIRGFGYRDVFDLMYFNTYILQKYGEDHHIIMYGQGMGANTILNTSGLGKLKNVDLIISEGAYDHVYHYLSQRCQKETKISSHICGPIIRQVLKSELHTDIKSMNTVALVKKNTIPTVYIHSKIDEDVPFSMVFSLYNHDTSDKFLFPIKDQYLYEVKDEDYLQSLKEFIQDHIHN